MPNNSEVINNFLGIFPNAVSKEYCEKVIKRVEYIQQAGGREGKILSRQEEEGISPMYKDNDTYFLGDDDNHISMEKDFPLLKEFNQTIWKCYHKYVHKYGVIASLSKQQIGPGVRIQKYCPGQGYHLWHCDADGAKVAHKILVGSLYLNTVKEGGETEFLYQGVRVPPVQGTVLLFPAGWTHPHRGNPPLKKNKYLLTTWLGFIG